MIKQRSTRPRRGVMSVLMLLTVGLACQQVAADETDVAGKMQYQNTCGGCHSVDENRIGPRHRNVVGRKVASEPGYDYSDALKALGGIWTPERLDQWLSGTQKMAPGSKMYLELDDAERRQMIIAYLKSVSEPTAGAPAQASNP